MTSAPHTRALTLSEKEHRFVKQLALDLRTTVSKVVRGSLHHVYIHRAAQPSTARLRAEVEALPNGGDPLVHTSVSLRDRDHERLVSLARRTGCDFSKLIRASVRLAAEQPQELASILEGLR